MKSAKAFASTIGPLAVVIVTELGGSSALAGAIGATIGAYAVWRIPNMVNGRNVMDIVDNQPTGGVADE